MEEKEAAAVDHLRSQMGRQLGKLGVSTTGLPDAKAHLDGALDGTNTPATTEAGRMATQGAIYEALRKPDASGRVGRLNPDAFYNRDKAALVADEERKGAAGAPAKHFHGDFTKGIADEAANFLNKVSEPSVDAAPSSPGRFYPENRSYPNTRRYPDNRSDPETRRYPDNRSDPETRRYPDNRSDPETRRYPDNRSDPETRRYPDNRSDPDTRFDPNTRRYPDNRFDPDTRTSPPIPRRNQIGI
jgi:hypothetical protein